MKRKYDNDKHITEHEAISAIEPEEFKRYVSKKEAPMFRKPSSPASAEKSASRAYETGTFSTRPSFEPNIEGQSVSEPDYHEIEPGYDPLNDNHVPTYRKDTIKRMRGYDQMIANVEARLVSDETPIEDTPNIAGLEAIVHNRHYIAKNVTKATFKSGDKVRHAKFGKGIVTAVILSSQEFVCVRFIDQTRKIAAAYLQLEESQ